MRVVVANRNNVGRVTFNRIAKVGTVSLENLVNVVTEGKQDGDVLVYQANTNTYNIKTLPNLDGGSF
jgi:hypothetical protein